jgi:4'-phosphopantetheinyl transferase EntD
VYGHGEERCRRRRITAGFWCISDALSSLDKGNKPSHATKANSWPNQVFAGRESGAVSHCNRWGVPAAECITVALPLFFFSFVGLLATNFWCLPFDLAWTDDARI